MSLINWEEKESGDLSIICCKWVHSFFRIRMNFIYFFFEIFAKWTKRYEFRMFFCDEIPYDTRKFSKM